MLKWEFLLLNLSKNEVVQASSREKFSNCEKKSSYFELVDLLAREIKDREGRSLASKLPISGKLV